jgi:hypothetical protein
LATASPGDRLNLNCNGEDGGRASFVPSGGSHFLVLANAGRLAG